MNEKFILRGEDTFHLAPFKYPWAWENVKTSIENTWFPTEISMGRDKECYENNLSLFELHTFKHVFATLTTADLAIASNLTERLCKLIKAAEIKAYIFRQIAEEQVHSLSYQHVLEVLGMDQEETYSLYHHVPEIANWFAFAKEQYERTDDMLLPLIFQYAIFEGVFFMTGFAPIYALQRNKKMVCTAQQIQYIHRDETAHVAFGTKLLNEIFKEVGMRPHTSEVHKLFVQAMDHLDRWAEFCIAPMLGYNYGLHRDHARFLANRRLRLLGYPELFSNTENVLPWLDEQANIKKEKNFFETRVTEYRNSSALHNTWD